ncbi:MAG: hypothetical protein PHC34_01310 [Candidatus Gastranaerophilales bacterium]|nr:hypothetical protein [Candidatus Gastranaerophilales bacterium]
MVGSVQSSSAQDANAISQQIQEFKDGKVNITKNDLKSTLANAIAQGEEPSDTVLDIVDSYDKIDTNSDGISYEELETYKNTPAGIISSMGLSPESLKRQQLSLFSSALSENNTTTTSSLFDTASTQTSLFSNYSSSSSNNNSSIFDFIT